jgi:hypothetical protein
VSETALPSGKATLGFQTLVSHPAFGRGKILAYDKDAYVILFKEGIKRVAWSFEGLTVEQLQGDPETDKIKQALREVAGDYGWIDADLEIGKRWVGGTMKLVPGKQDTQSKEIPLEMLFKKIIGIRDKLRVLEQKINVHPQLSLEDKLELQGYITRCYGSLTTFNVLFAAKESQFQGQSE